MDIEKIFEEGEEYYVNGDYNKALEYFQNGYKISKNEDFLNYIGCCYLNLNKFEEAISTFEELMQVYPEWERPVFNLGRVYLKLELYQEALDYFNKALVINPDDEDVYFYFGIYFEKKRDYKNAICCQKKSLRLNKFQPETHLHLGLCYLRTNKYNEAIVEFDMCCKQDNNCEDAIYNKAITLFCMGRYMQSLYTSLDLYKANPNDVENILNIGECYYRLGNLSYAENHFNEVLKIDSLNKVASGFLKKIHNKKE
ncbi:tetratricopeptide (TPR) repeat protein [Clostridium acetobutylicum]|uniref:TPR-repeat-containing protein n=1 Tax=Clostridium acetobutylicum (strain ATCC 824 / DSM 792 / JCM 1419 / IAM 19013 / LMG 5710 / NBRC 13948 / NRRL B-527 / VKM B-1787 / 2291 / W) TaxID=272562 RepID=Q97K56_CLOAB|nr:MULTISPECIES: tetratricopeptide repeat protein [Clostridium]AAK79039.1 TPR-repeat-containing protein [Clostridium acetobutylicum ATCC 824]ADZ20114.1 TPR-repeat-containing protein [Clostridium acetobutylicum EA 2018]AEI33792.1 TPR repeat-containing protein [Clostridium acetobutylicum DSM 1731]AWV81706.1 tetratricopeptide repeat protein [Clostridium acetobutylicum]MBC2395246.1 tetratricopeptide repeat protein [Clostridium acetobutylicum]